MCSFDVCLSVCVCARSGPVNQTSLKWELNADNCKTVKATNFKFDTRVPRDSPDMTPKNFPKGGVARVTWPPEFFPLNANSSKMVKATDFKFGTRFPRDSPDMTP